MDPRAGGRGAAGRPRPRPAHRAGGGKTYDSARAVMIDGERGSWPVRRRPAPEWVATRRALVWPNGAEALLFSAHDPRDAARAPVRYRLGGELAKWKEGARGWDMLQFCLRLGDRPQSCVTTTPQRVSAYSRVCWPSRRPSPPMRPPGQQRLSGAPISSTRSIAAMARARSAAGTGRRAAGRTGWARGTHAMLDAAKRGATGARAPARIVVAVDPPAGSGAPGGYLRHHRRGPSCATEGAPPQALVLEDASLQGASPTGWAKAADRRL